MRKRLETELLALLETAGKRHSVEQLREGLMSTLTDQEIRGLITSLEHEAVYAEHHEGLRASRMRVRR